MGVDDGLDNPFGMNQLLQVHLPPTLCFASLFLPERYADSVNILQI